MLVLYACVCVCVCLFGRTVREYCTCVEKSMLNSDFFSVFYSTHFWLLVLFQVQIGHCILDWRWLVQFVLHWAPVWHVAHGKEDVYRHTVLHEQVSILIRLFTLFYICKTIDYSVGILNAACTFLIHSDTNNIDWSA